jgi:hypothetical protein
MKKNGSLIAVGWRHICKYAAHNVNILIKWQHQFDEMKGMVSVMVL